MIVLYDKKKNQPYVEWSQGPNGFKRAWIRTADAGTDWANTGRYVNVVRIDALGGGPAGQSTDFPIFHPATVSSEQILVAFVAAVCGLTGCAIP